MSNPYIGEIRLFGGNFAPVGWAFCDGQLLSITQNEVLFTLLGTTYGGDGVTTFALPDMRGRVPIHQTSSYPIGMAAGAESVTLTVNQMPAHAHTLLGSSAVVEGASPAGSAFATSEDTAFYAPYNPAKTATMNPGVVGPAGGTQTHDNMQPFICVSFIIALEGIFPSQG